MLPLLRRHINEPTCVSSQTEGNQFTGMAYQGLLLSDRRRLRTESIEEHATPNSSPAQWPGENLSFCCFFFLIFYLAIPF